MLNKLFAVTLLLAAPAVVSAQTALMPDEALTQIYKDYDSGKRQAKWVCGARQKSTDPATRDGWTCDEGETVRVSALLTVQLKEGLAWKTYVVTSAIPGENYECHSCGPAIGVAIFEWREGHWLIQNSDAAVGFYGSWGGGPSVELVAIGPAQHGVILWTSGGGQGYHGSEKHLIALGEKTFREVWTLNGETDNSGAYDPTDKLAPHRRYYAEAAFKFLYVGNDDYYDILVMSRGTDSKGKANWTKQYRFRDGQYQLLQTTKYFERTVPANKLAQPRSPRSK